MGEHTVHFCVIYTIGSCYTCTAREEAVCQALLCEKLPRIQGYIWAAAGVGVRMSPSMIETSGPNRFPHHPIMQKQ